jgi:hypothetical protein
VAAINGGESTVDEIVGLSEGEERMSLLVGEGKRHLRASLTTYFSM